MPFFVRILDCPVKLGTKRTDTKYFKLGNDRSGRRKSDAITRAFLERMGASLFWARHSLLQAMQPSMPFKTLATIARP